MDALRVLTHPVEDDVLFGGGVFLPKVSCDSEADDRVAALRTAALRTAADAVSVSAVVMRELSMGGNVPSAGFLYKGSFRPACCASMR